MTGCLATRRGLLWRDSRGRWEPSQPPACSFFPSCCRRLLRPTRSIQGPAIQSPGYINQSGQQRQRTGHQHHYEEYTCQITAHRTRELQTHDGSQPHGGGWRFPVGTVRDDIRQREIYERHRQKVDAEGIVLKPRRLSGERLTANQDSSQNRIWPGTRNSTMRTNPTSPTKPSCPHMKKLKSPKHRNTG